MLRSIFPDGSRTPFAAGLFHDTADQGRLADMATHLGPVLVTRERIAARVAELGQQITHDFSHPHVPEGGKVVVVPIMTGAMIFCADLIRHMPLRLRIGTLLQPCRTNYVWTCDGRAMAVGWQIGRSKEVFAGSWRRRGGAEWPDTL